MKKLMIFALCTMMTLSLAACGSSFQEDAVSSSGSPAAADSSQAGSSGAPAEENTQIPNPFVECDTLEQAAGLAGFSITVPEQASEELTDRLIFVVKDALIEVIYQNGDSEDEVRIRKGTGSGDVSGDYNQYAESSTVAVDDLQVTMKGNDATVVVATWTDGDYAYSVRASGGIDSDSMAELVRAVK